MADSSPITPFAGKRTHDDAFPGELSPNSPSKRLCLGAAEPIEAGQQDQAEPTSSSPLSSVHSSGIISVGEQARLEAARLAGQEELPNDRIEKSRNDIKIALVRIKDNSPDGEIDSETSCLLIDELTALMQLCESQVATWKETVSLRVSAAAKPTTYADASTSTDTFVSTDTSTSTDALATTDASTSTKAQIYTDAATTTDIPTYASAETSTNVKLTDSGTLMDASTYVNAQTSTHVELKDAHVQTDPTPGPSRSALFELGLQTIRRDAPLVNIRMTNVYTAKVRLRQPTKQPNSKPWSNISPPRSMRDTASDRSLFAPPVTTKKKQVILLDDSSDEDQVQPSTSHRVGGAGLASTSFSSEYVEDVVDYGDDDVYIDDDGDDDDDDEMEVVGFGPVSITRPPSIFYGGEQPEFYGIPSNRANLPNTRTRLRYQDDEAIGLAPSPRVGLRLRFEKYLHDISSKHITDVQYHINNILDKTSWGGPAFHSEQSFQQSWVNARSNFIINGLPLVEKVDFLVVGNHASPSGDCYWRAISFHLYGSDRHWDLVKAEHLAFVYQVLGDPYHPRHELYDGSLNAKFFDTQSVRGVSPFVANMWQMLHMPHVWAPGVMQQVTADLYGVCLHTFSYDAISRRCGEVNVRGAYNSRHIFLLFADGQHFQPMTPNDYWGWEFRYPRVDVASTARFANAPRPTSAKSTLEHPWRNDWTKHVMPPVPRSHGCDFNALRRLMGSDPRA